MLNKNLKVRLTASRLVSTLVPLISLIDPKTTIGVIGEEKLLFIITIQKPPM